MSLFDSDLLGGRRWARVGDFYEVTRKPRGLEFPEVVPFVPMDAIPSGGAFAPRFIEKPATAIASGTYFERGDILIAKITPSFENGKQALASDMPAPFGFATTEVIPLRPKNPDHDSRLLFFYLLHPDVRSYVTERMEGTTGRQRVPEDVLLDLPIPLLSRHDQSVVADSLKLVRDAIRVEQRSSDDCSGLNRVVMRELFTRGTRSESQKDTDIGNVPESWTRETLGDVSGIAYGAQAAVASQTDPSIGTLILTNINITIEGNIDLEKKRYYGVPEHQRDRLMLSRGDVLFNWRSGSAEHVGKTAYFDLEGEYAYSSFILRFRPHRAVSGKFLFRYLTHLRREGFFTSRRNVSSINSVYNASLAATIPIWFPTPDEQEQIVAILDAIDRKTQLHRGKRTVLKQLFEALLHKLMTGEILVADLDLTALETVTVQVSA